MPTIKRGRPKKGDESFSDRVYKAAVVLWRNGYRPFTRQNIIDYFELRLNQKVDINKITSALDYLRSKGLVKSKGRNRWHLIEKKVYPDKDTQKYYYFYHPLPRCADCIWLKHKNVKEPAVTMSGKLTTTVNKEPVCSCPDSQYYNKVVDVHIARPECTTSRPYIYKGYLGEREIYRRGLHVNPFYPKKYFKLEKGKVVWKED